MRIVEIPDCGVGNAASTEEMMELLFGLATMQDVHGDGVQLGAWTRVGDRGFHFRRTIKTDTPYPSGMPTALCCALGSHGSHGASEDRRRRLRMTVGQRIECIPSARADPVAHRQRCAKCHFRSACGAEVDAVAEFDADVDVDVYLVRNSVRLHVLGAELCKVIPAFRISRDRASGRMTLGAAVKLYAILPPPLDKLCEGFVASVCKAEVDLYVDSVRRRDRRDGRLLSGEVEDIRM